MRRGAGGDDGKVIGDLGVVENSLGMFDPLILEDGARVRILGLAQRRFDCRNVILGQIT